MDEIALNSNDIEENKTILSNAVAVKKARLVLQWPPIISMVANNSTAPFSILYYPDRQKYLVTPPSYSNSYLTYKLESRE